MSVFISRDGNISIFRIGLLLIGLGLAAGIGGFVLFQLDIAQRRSPLFIDRYPGAEEWFRQEISDNEQLVVYQVPGVDPELVAEFYQNELDERFNDGVEPANRERCVRNPIRGQFDDYVEGSGNLPYYYRCAFDNSSFGATQFTFITIEPGVRNDSAEPPVDTTGMTIIQYEQTWAN